MSKEDTAVLLISHGSTRPYGKVVFDEIKEKFIEKTGLKTEVGYMKVSDSRSWNPHPHRHSNHA